MEHHAVGHDDWSRYREVGFLVHGVDAVGVVVAHRQLKCRYVLDFVEKLAPWVVGIRARAISHHWSRELKCHNCTADAALAYVKPYVRGGGTMRPMLVRDKSIRMITSLRRKRGGT